MDQGLRESVRKRAGNACEYCHIPQDATPLIAFHVEHIVSRQHGGSDDPAGPAHLSPGQHPKHYCPRTPVLIAGRDPSPPGARVMRISVAALPVAQLYATLHHLDDEGYDAILVELPPETPEWAAVRERLLRAASK